MTKVELAEKIVSEFPNDTVFNNTSLGLALQILGRTTNEEDEYLSSRSGVGIKNYAHLMPTEIRTRIDEFTSLRDIFDILD